MTKSPSDGDFFVVNFEINCIIYCVINRKDVLELELLLKRSKHRSLFLIVCALFLSWILFLTPARADNHDVMDDAGVLDQQTERYIYDVNQNQMAKIKGHPQIAVITKKSVDGSIEDEAQQLFNHYRFGTKGYDNGVLLLIDVGGHHVRMQTGYGIESAVPDNFVNQLMNSDVQADFRDDNYSAGTKKMVKKLANRIVAKQSDLRSKSDVNNHQAAIEAQEQQDEQAFQQMAEQLQKILIWILALVSGLVLILWFIRLIYRYKQARFVEKSFNDLKDQLQQQSSVSNLDVNWDAIRLPSPDETWLLGQLAQGKLTEDTLSDTLREMLNILLLNQLVQHYNADWSLLADDGSVTMSTLAQAIMESVGLLNFKQNYQVLTDRLISYLIFVNGLDGMIEQQNTKVLQSSLVSYLDRVIASQRTGWPDVDQNEIDAAIRERVNQFQKTGLHRMQDLSQDRDDLVHLLQVYLQGHSMRQAAWLDMIFNKHEQEVLSKLVDRLDGQQYEAHVAAVESEFDQMMNRPNIKNLIDDDKLAYIDDLTLQQKERALEHKDNAAAFRAAVAGYLAGYLSSSLSSSWDDDDDDDWFGGSGFGGGGFDGGSFGGGGGFSGGGGGTASW